MDATVDILFRRLQHPVRGDVKKVVVLVGAHHPLSVQTLRNFGGLFKKCYIFELINYYPNKKRKFDHNCLGGLGEEGVDFVVHHSELPLFLT